MFLVKLIVNPIILVNLWLMKGLVVVRPTIFQVYLQEILLNILFVILVKPVKSRLVVLLVHVQQGLSMTKIGVTLLKPVYLRKVTVKASVHK